MRPVRFAFLAAMFAVAFAPSPAPAQWTNGQAAVRVVGQTGFGLSVPGTTAIRMANPSGVCIDAPNGKLYVSDRNNHRVLRFAYPVASNGPTAEAVFGQPSFTVATANNGGRSASSINFPGDVEVDPAGTLYVADSDNHRILVFSSAHLAPTTGTAASKVFGQASFSTANIATTTAGLSSPFDCVFEAPDRLWVADGSNRRVLRFDNVSAKANGAPADGVLGQPDFTTAVTTTSAAGIGVPYGLAVHQGTLYIADENNNRVIRHANASAKANGAAADGVLGRPDFTSSAAGAASTSMDGPSGLWLDASGRLYVADFGNNRVTTFDDAVNKTNGAAADRVLGQAGFGTSASGTAANQMQGPGGVAADDVNDRLVVADLLNNRVTVFQATAPLPVAVSAVAVE